MSQKIVGFFCGPNYTKLNDACFQKIQESVTSDTTLLAYDGDTLRSRDLFSGIDEKADAFIEDLKQNMKTDETDYQLNIVAHSRGMMSALLAIKKIQADPDLKNRIKITADFRNGEPGNMANAYRLYDLSDCDVVKKVYVTLLENPSDDVTIPALLPKFHHATALELEVLPGAIHEEIEHKTLLALGHAKTLSILETDGIELNPQAKEFSDFKEQQIAAYDELVSWAKAKASPFYNKDVLFDGQLVVNNHYKNKLDAMNWRHAQLKGTTPNHILYTSTHPDYNYRKTPLEQICDVFQAMDNFTAHAPNQEVIIDAIREKTGLLLTDITLVKEYRKDCQNLLNLVAINDENINKAISYLCMQDYLVAYDQAVKNFIFPDDPLLENLQNLRVHLLEELTAEIEHGTIFQMDQSNAIKIANNTANFLEYVYQHATSREEIIQCCENYANENIRFGRNWNLGSKIIAGTVLVIASTIVGCIIGAAIGLGIGFACGVISGPGALITAFVALLTSASIGAAVGFSAGVYGAHHFFKPSPTETQIQDLSNALKIEMADTLESLDSLEPSHPSLSGI